MTRRKPAPRKLLLSVPPVSLVFLSLASLAQGMAHSADVPQLESKVEAEDIRAGLVAVHRHADSPAPIAITQLESTIALSLKPTEASHPRLGISCGTVKWTGYLNILRPGIYRFSGLLRGRFRLQLGHQEIMAAEVRDAVPQLRTAPEARLEAGVYALTADFTRLPGVARVEVFWQAPHIRTEPLPYTQLGHLPAEETSELKTSQQIERGRFLAEENNCTRCHQPVQDDAMARGLLARQAPDLSQIGQRAFAPWIYRWLESPQKLWPAAAMPHLFSPDQTGQAGLYAVTRYLASLGGPLKPESQKLPNQQRQESVSRGRRLFVGLGCLACHQTDAAKATTAAARNYELSGFGSKTTPQRLAAYLENPLAVDPGGRMPHMLLRREEAGDLARYLCQYRSALVDAGLPAAPTQELLVSAFQRVESRVEEIAAFKRLDHDSQYLDLGKRIVIEKRCNNCHTIAPEGRAFANVLARASFEVLRQPRSERFGCLAEANQSGMAPQFPFSAADRSALRVFLREGTTGKGSPAPAHAARAALERFNCLACHVRDGRGGLKPDIIEELRRVEKAENAEAVSPPPLTGASHKLRTAWLKQVLTQVGRARPWMSLRMPQFGEANVGWLPEALAALEGTEAGSTAHQVALTTARVAAGRQLVGKSGLGCVSCHDIAGIANFGTRGPDLALMNQRVRHEWYERWLEQPQRMQPGTRMPTVFVDGKSLLPTILGGDARAQADAMWAYLSLGKNLPLPEGVEPTRGLVLAVRERPVLLRTFMPEAGSRAVAVGYPGGVSLAFDAATCRLAYAWSGSFLDASPVWNDRGGNPARILGSRFWIAPPGCPWDTTLSSEPPPFAARATDPAFGANLPEGQVFKGQSRLQFESYTTDKTGMPSFRYRLQTEDGQSLRISERPEPLHHATAAGLTRHFTVDRPAQANAWLTAGQSKRSPRVLTPKGTPYDLNWKSGKVEAETAGRIVALPQDDERLVLLQVVAAPEGTHWSLRLQDGVWQALLRLPASAESTRQALQLNTWVLPRDDQTLLSEFLHGDPRNRLP